MKPGEKKRKRGWKVFKKNETWRKKQKKRLESVKKMKPREKKRKRDWNVGMGLKTGENKNKKRLGSIQKGMKTEENKKKIDKNLNNIRKMRMGNVEELLME